MSEQLIRPAANLLSKSLDDALDLMPGGMGTVFKWNGYFYVGALWAPYPEKPYIVAVRKSPLPVSQQEIASLKKQRPLTEIAVHPNLDFGGDALLLGLSQDTLMAVSGEDIVYCMVHRRHDPVFRMAGMKEKAG